jgi:hypothetical protein
MSSDAKFPKHRDDSMAGTSPPLCKFGGEVVA